MEKENYYFRDGSRKRGQTRARNSLKIGGFGTLLAAWLLLCVSCAVPPASSPGLLNGRLPPCPASPNCVNSAEVGKTSFIEPIVFKTAPARAWPLMKLAIADLGGTIQEEDRNYLRASFTTLFFRFKDDLEVHRDDANNRFQVRSASRVGYSDFGVNRRRVEQLRARFAGLCRESEPDCL